MTADSFSALSSKDQIVIIDNIVGIKIDAIVVMNTKCLVSNAKGVCS